MTAAFNPFTDRPSRDLRNRLGFRFVDSIRDGNVEWVEDAAGEFASQADEPVLKAYLENRIMRYARVVSFLEDGSAAAGDVYGVAAILWNEGLYFECHEWLEQLWKSVSDVEKQVLQALIRTAGACELARYGRTASARSTSLKALDVFSRYPDRVPAAFDMTAMRVRLTTISGSES